MIRGTVLPVVAFALWVNLALALGGTSPPAAGSDLKRELDAQLPAESRHAFGPVSKQWLNKVAYVHPVLLERYPPEKVSEEQKKRLEREEVYSPTGRREAPYRVLTYDPAGHLIFVGDWTGDEAFAHSLYADGSTSQYIHRRKGKLLAAYSCARE